MRNRILSFLAQFILRRSWLVVIAGVALAALSVAYARTSLRLNANLDDLIARDRPYMDDYRRFLREFGDLEYIIVAIDAAKDRAVAERAADDLLARLRALPDLPGVHGTIDSDEQLRIATRGMSDDELRDLAMAAEALPVLLTADAGSIVRHADALLARLISGGASLSPDDQQRLAAAATLLLEAVTGARNPESRVQRLIVPPPRQYLASGTGKFLFINILPAKDYSTLSVIEEPLRRIRAAIDETRRAFPTIDIGLTGKPVMQYDEMATSNDDMTRASIIAFVLCGILFMLMIGGVVRPLLAMIAFGMAAAWTYGFATLAIGQLNLLSLVFMLVLVGVGLDYGVHVINRYQEFLARGDSVRDSIRGAMRTAVRGNITGALTSSVVFFMACFTTFQGLRELGLIAGGGLILCLIAMSAVLPALLKIAEDRREGIGPRRATPTGLAANRRGLSGADAWIVRHARGILSTTVIVTAALGLLAILGPGGGGRFDHNLLNLQAQGLESVEWERRILRDEAGESWFGAAIAEDQSQALQIIEKARGKPTIGAVRSAFDIARPDSPQRGAWRASLHTTGRGPVPTAGSANLSEDLASANAKLRLVVQGAALHDPDEARPLQDLHERLRSMDVTDLATRKGVDATLQAIASTLRSMLAGDRMPLSAALPAAVRKQFVSENGRYLVMLHPKGDVWDYASMRAFIADMRAVDASITGVPITHFESLGEMRAAFITMSLLAAGAIAVLLVFDFRSVRDALLALAPLVVSMIWTLGAMRLLGVSINLANFFALPMLIGLGVDSAVHILHRYHEGADACDRLHFGRTRRAVVLTALTTIIGFGALVIAHHRGLRSLGLVMAIGSTACMLASIVILPALLVVREQRMQRQHRSSPDGGND